VTLLVKKNPILSHFNPKHFTITLITPTNNSINSKYPINSPKKRNQTGLALALSVLIWFFMRYILRLQTITMKHLSSHGTCGHKKNPILIVEN